MLARNKSPGQVRDVRISCSDASHGQHCVNGPKTTLKFSGRARVLAFPFNSYLKIEAAISMFVTCKLSVEV